MLNIRQELLRYIEDNQSMFLPYHDLNRLENVYEFMKDRYNPRNFNKERLLGYKYLRFGKHRRNVNEVLKLFLTTTLDQVRLRYANAFAEYALYICDMQDLSYFREAVTRREFSKDVDYGNQRDHAAHTLYNYLLGWYIFDNSGAFQEAFYDYCKNRKISFEPTKDEYDLYRSIYNRFNTFCSGNFLLANNFGDVWPLASLLHDIGYIFEGSLSPASSEVEHDRITRGAKVVHDYFSHWFWRDLKIDTKTAKCFTEILQIVLPDFSRMRSIAALADYLCDVGSCEWIRQAVKKENIINNSSPFDFNIDALHLWEEYYYKQNNNDKLKKIFNVIREEFKRRVWKGSEDSGRTLNHAVCSGLISLMALSFFADLYFGIKLNYYDEASYDCYRVHHKFKLDEFDIKQKHILHKKEYQKISKSVFRDVSKHILFNSTPYHMEIRGAYDANWWFKKYLWGTSAAAIHDIMQAEDWKLIYHDFEFNESIDSDPPQLSIEDDPIAYLGVLVDILQEWDRYTVSGKSAFVGTHPLQGTEVLLYTNRNGKVVLNFPKDKNKRKDAVKTALDRCLTGWRSIIDLRQYTPK